jgi:hypothetical protein
MQAIGINNVRAVVELLGQLRILYDAATANMVYTSDFPRLIYETVVRPSMMPPFLSPGFSGTLNTEHNVMLDRLKQLREALQEAFGSSKEEWPVGVARAWSELSQAQARNRRHHGLICSKFVPDGVSLLRHFYTDARRTEGQPDKEGVPE